MTALCNKLAKFEGARERIYAADLVSPSECKAKLQKLTSSLPKHETGAPTYICAVYEYSIRKFAANLE
jgi:hypothetical protein